MGGRALRLASGENKQGQSILSVTVRAGFLQAYIVKYFIPPRLEIYTEGLMRLTRMSSSANPPDLPV